MKKHRRIPGFLFFVFVFVFVFFFCGEGRKNIVDQPAMRGENVEKDGDRGLLG